MSPIAYIIASLILSAFFSGCEMAFVTSNKLLMELNKTKHPFLSKIIDHFIKSPGIFISTMLVGNNIALVIYGLEMGGLIHDDILRLTHSELGTLFLQTLFSTLIILLTAEFLPKTLFRINPTFVLNTLALPLYFFYILFYPISKFTLGFSNFILKKILKVPVPKRKNNLVFGRIDFDNLLNKHQETALSEEQIPQEVKLLKNALGFQNIKVRECTIPRTDIAAIEVNEPFEVLQQKFIDTGLSKILIFKENIDNIIGYIHVSEIFKNPKKLRNSVTPILVVPESMSANKLLEQLIQEHKSISLVVDEFGGTAGIVTMEDILEEIFGEIDDEHDTSDFIHKQIGPNEFIFSGRLEVDYINENFSINLPASENYETIAGMVLHHNPSIPEKNEFIDLEEFTIEILEVTSSRINLVRILKKENN